jgi:hypothetical protein
MSTICFGMSLGLPYLEMTGWGVFISPNTKIVVGEKLCSLRHTGQSGAPPDSALFTVRCT